MVTMTPCYSRIGGGVGVYLWWGKTAGTSSESLSFIHMMLLSQIGFIYQPDVVTLLLALLSSGQLYQEKAAWTMGLSMLLSFRGAVKRLANFRNYVEILETVFKKKDLIIVEPKRKKKPGLCSICSLFSEASINS